MTFSDFLIVGCGSMGAGIVYIIAKNIPNSKIYVLEASSEQQKKARVLFQKWERKDKLESISNRVHFMDSFDSCLNIPNRPQKEFDVLLEVASENMSVKEEIFSHFNSFSRTDSLIASNTSSLSLTKMASKIDPSKRSRVVGLHFFNPPRIMQLVEIIQTLDTSDETLEDSKELSRQLEKEIVLCKDSPGFITSRLGITLLNEAVFVLEQGIASAEDIDKAMKLGFNHPMGPLKLADFIGLDVVFAVTQSLYENYQDSKYRPSMLLRKKVEAGHLGYKSGKGFYTYEKSV